MNGTLTTLNELLPSDRLFEIPIYQRGYAWEEENLRDLWDDLDYLDDRDHYFGTILLKKAGKKTRAGLRTFDHFEVIDGQQRLTTTLILLRELISQFKELGDEEVRDQASKLEEDYVGLAPHYKLTIGNEDEEFFRDSILAGRSAVDPMTRAQERLRNARAFFRARFDQRREGQGPDGYRDFLIDFKSRIDRLQVMLYIVPSTAEAVRMFETVNDRGRPLTNLEKTKSILMYAAYLVVDDSTTLDKLLSEMNSQFSEIYRVLPGHRGGARASRCLAKSSAITTSSSSARELCTSTCRCSRISSWRRAGRIGKTVNGSSAGMPAASGWRSERCRTSRSAGGTALPSGGQSTGCFWLGRLAT